MRQIKSPTLNRGFNAYLFGKKDHLSRDQKKQKDQAISNLRSTYGDDFESHIVPKALKSSYKPIITPLKLELTLNQSLEDLANAYGQIEQLESKLRHTKENQKDQTALDYENTENKYNELVIKYNELFEAASLMKSTLDGKKTAVEVNQGKICQLEATIAKLREVPKAMHAEFAHRIALLEKERDERLTLAQSAKLMAELSEMNKTSRSDKEIIKTLNNQILELQSRLIEQQKNHLAQMETSKPKGKNTDQPKTIQQSVRSWLKHFFE